MCDGRRKREFPSQVAAQNKFGIRISKLGNEPKARATSEKERKVREVGKLGKLTEASRYSDTLDGASRR